MAINDQLKKLYKTITGNDSEGMAVDEIISELNANYPAGSGGGSLPADFPAEGLANANKFVGFDENGDYTAKAAPSGGELVVGIVYDDVEKEYVAQHNGDPITIAEIISAKEAGKTVIAEYANSANMVSRYVLSTVISNSPMFGVTFVSELPSDDKNTFYSFTGVNEDDKDVWSNAEFAIPYSDSSDDGKVFVVNHNGQISLVDPLDLSSAPLKLTVSAAQSDPDKFDFTGATAEEIYNAFVAGRSVIAQATYDQTGGITNDHYVFQMELSTAVRHSDPSDPTSAAYSFEFKAFNSNALSLIGFSGILANANLTDGVAQEYVLTPVNP